MLVTRRYEYANAHRIRVEAPNTYNHNNNNSRRPTRYGVDGETINTIQYKPIIG